MRGLGFGFVCCLLATSAAARDLFVSNERGDDRNDGLTAEVIGGSNGPFHTIGRALISARKGDRIILTPGNEPFRESITLQGGNHSGIEGYPFEIIGNGAVLEGLGPVGDDAWEHVRDNVFRFRPARVSFQTFFLGATPAVRLRPGPEGFGPLKPLEWALAEGDLYFRTEKDTLPQAYAPRGGMFSVGITLYEVRHVRIRNLVVRGYQLDGINAHDSAVDVVLEGVTSESSGRSGFSIGGSSRVELLDCRATGNGTAQVRVDDYARLHLVKGKYVGDEAAPALVRDGGKVTEGK